MLSPCLIGKDSLPPPPPLLLLLFVWSAEFSHNFQVSRIGHINLSVEEVAVCAIHEVLMEVDYV
jgi:hypothetical protein